MALYEGVDGVCLKLRMIDTNYRIKTLKGKIEKNKPKQSRIMLKLRNTPPYPLILK